MTVSVPSGATTVTLPGPSTDTSMGAEPSGVRGSSPAHAGAAPVPIPGSSPRASSAARAPLSALPPCLFLAKDSFPI